MPLHFPTLGLVLLTVGIHTSVIMIIIWRMYRHMKGPGYWAVAALLTMLGFLPMWLEPKIGTLAIILNNFATVTTPLLIFEGVIKFRNFHPFDDEFILLLTCHNSEDILAQKLHRIINAIESPAIIENTSMILSMSYGSAKFPTDGTTSDELFKVADQRMYMQKRSRTK